MGKSLEYEARVMLSITQYNKLLLLMSKINPITLINEYFDDDNCSIIKSRKMLRIRNLNFSGYELTLKIKGENGDTEYNQPISPEERDLFIKNGIFPDGEVKNLVKDIIPLETISLITSLKTMRYEKNIEDYLFVLDKNEYNGIVDYNLEIESDSKQKSVEIIKKYCKDYNIQYSEKYKGKSRRAILSVKGNL